MRVGGEAFVVTVMDQLVEVVVLQTVSPVTLLELLTPIMNSM